MLLVLLLLILVALIVVASRLGRVAQVQRAAAIAADVDINAVSRWRCTGCGMKSKTKPECCIRCKGAEFQAY
jgi:hypothetical protein